MGLKIQIIMVPKNRFFHPDSKDGKRSPLYTKEQIAAGMVYKPLPIKTE